MPSLTEAQIEEAVLRDYRELVGKIILVRTVDGYDAEGHDATVTCDPPAIARVRAYDENQVRGFVTRWMDDANCDPQYEIDIVEPHPAFGDISPFWIYGISRSTDGVVGVADFVVADDATQDRYRDVPALAGEVGACAPPGMTP